MTHGEAWMYASIGMAASAILMILTKQAVRLYNWVKKRADENQEYREKLLCLPLCQKCGGAMLVDNYTIYTSIPPRYKRKCIKCGFEEIAMFGEGKG